MIRIGIIENTFYFYNSLLKNPCGMSKASIPQHGDFVVERMLQEIKELEELHGKLEFELYALPTSLDAVRKAIELNLDIINLSRTHSGIDENIWKNIAESYNITLFAAAGNDGENEEEYAAQQDFWIAVGALNLLGNRTSYSSWGLGAVLCMAQGDYISHIAGFNGILQKGTSFACPTAVATHAFFVQKYKLINNKKVSLEESIKFIQNNCKDMEKTGKDLPTGFGKYELREEFTLSNDAFNDDNGKWFEDDVNYLVDKGIIKGYPDGTIKGEKLLTRAEVFHLIATQQREIDALHEVIDSLKK